MWRWGWCVAVACSDGSVTFVDLPGVAVDPGTAATGSGPAAAGAYVPGSFTLIAGEPGFDLTWDLGDLDGDGWVDAIAEIRTGEGELDERAIVYGPLRDLALPADVSVSFDNASWRVPAIGEFTGAPPADVVLPAASGDTYVIPGPWAGSLQVDDAWIPYGGDPRAAFDLNGDGILDEAALTSADTLQITFGPADRLDGPVDVTIDLCDTGDGGYPQQSSLLHAAGDLDGDGLTELSVLPHASSYVGACGGFTVSVPASGLIDPFDPEAAEPRAFVTAATAIGDWDGDGLPEAVDGAELLWSPIALTEAGVVAARRQPLDAAAVSAAPTPFDLSGDGQPELLVRTLAGSYLVRSGPSVGAMTEWVGAAWATELFVEQGQAMFAYEADGELLALRLGPAL